MISTNAECCDRSRYRLPEQSPWPTFRRIATCSAGEKRTMDERAVAAAHRPPTNLPRSQSPRLRNALSQHGTRMTSVLLMSQPATCTQRNMTSVVVTDACLFDALRLSPLHSGWRRPYSRVVRGSACPARYCTSSNGTPCSNRSVIVVTRNEWGDSRFPARIGGAAAVGNWFGWFADICPFCLFASYTFHWACLPSFHSIRVDRLHAGIAGFIRSRVFGRWKQSGCHCLRRERC